MNQERRKGSQEITETLLDKDRGVFKRGVRPSSSFRPLPFSRESKLLTVKFVIDFKKVS